MNASTAQRLLAAGPRLSEQYSFQELSEARICAAAGISAEDLQDFGGILGFVNALQQQFMDGLRDRILKITSGTASGVNRIQLACETYLTGCLEQRELRAWLIEARALPEVLAGLRRQNQGYWMVLGAELGSLKWPHPQLAARLFLAMINEASVVEHRAGQPVAAVRDALWDFLLRGSEKAVSAG